jgi:hypothetical protein
MCDAPERLCRAPALRACFFKALLAFFLGACPGIIAQTITNGAETAGTLLANTTNSYTFAATNGDAIVLRIGAPVINPRITLFSPTGVNLGSAGSGVSGAHDAVLRLQATNTGTFTVAVSSVFFTPGDYVLRLARIPGEFIVSPGDNGGALTNGTANTGTNSLGDLDLWSFTATAGDTIVLRLGAAAYNPRLDLYGPDGRLLATDGSGTSGDHDVSVSVQATNSGIFTVISSAIAGFGNYTLHLAKAPGEFVISPGDNGGALLNGTLNRATNSLGDLDLWSFDANAGDTIVLRMGSFTFNPWIRLYNPSGVLVGNVGSGASGVRDVDLVVPATNSGTFTVIASSFVGTGVGNYVLSLAKSPGAVLVSPGDEGGSMTNGWQHTGALEFGDLDVWTFDASNGDSIVLRMSATNYNPLIRLYGPNGVLLGSAGSGVSGNRDVDLSVRATNSGSFTVVAGSVTATASTGNYLLNLAKSGAPVFVSPGDQGGTISNGWQHSGTIDLGDLDVFTFSAAAGDSIVLRMGSPNFNPWLRLYGPNGVLVGTAGSGAANNLDVDLAIQATNSGTFTVVAASFTVDSGVYILNLAHSPAAVFASPGDEGGLMVNGWKYTGMIDLGDLDVWSFPANAGDNLVLRMAATNYNPWIRLYSPTGGLVRAAGSGVSGNRDVNFSVPATNGGIYTVVASSFTLGAGNYLINLARMPAAFSVAPDDEGGTLSTGISRDGAIEYGDMDLWRFAGCRGQPISVICQKLSGANFTPRLRLYGRDGALLATAINATTAVLNFSSTNTGVFVALVDGSGVLDAGTYRLSGNGLTDELNLCPPLISGAGLTVGMVGGLAGGNFVLYTSTNIAAPVATWAPILTNQFDQFGSFEYMGVFNPAEPWRFFYLIEQ